LNREIKNYFLRFVNFEGNNSDLSQNLSMCKILIWKTRRKSAKVKVTEWVQIKIHKKYGLLFLKLVLIGSST
jgi:hypothetical protein